MKEITECLEKFMPVTALKVFDTASNSGSGSETKQEMKKGLGTYLEQDPSPTLIEARLAESNRNHLTSPEKEKMKRELEGYLKAYPTLINKVIAQSNLTDPQKEKMKRELKGYLRTYPMLIEKVIAQSNLTDLQKEKMKRELQGYLKQGLLLMIEWRTRSNLTGPQKEKMKRELKECLKQDLTRIETILTQSDHLTRLQKEKIIKDLLCKLKEVFNGPNYENYLFFDYIQAEKEIEKIKTIEEPACHPDIEQYLSDYKKALVKEALEFKKELKADRLNVLKGNIE